jgi:hypothetical protein
LKVLRKVGFVSTLMMMLMVMMIVTPSTSAFFWSDSPTSWSYGDDPAQIPAVPDGTGYATVTNYGIAYCDSDLTGGSEETPYEIDYINLFVGDSLMFCVDYHLTARPDPYNRDTQCMARLEYDLWDDDISDWVFGDSMTVDVQTFFPAIMENSDDGWLYVYIDTDYTGEPLIRLTLITYTKYWDYGWVNFGNSPQSTSVYFEVDDETY